MDLTEKRTFLLMLAFSAAIVFPGLLQAQTSSLAIARPCGPDNLPDGLRIWIPQGFLGADFRPACRQHDQSYSQTDAIRADCDQGFRDNLICACQNSRRPVACRMVARTMY